MKKNTAAIDAFIDERYLPLDPKYKIILAIAIVLLPVVAFFFIFFQPNVEDLGRLAKKKTKINQEIRTVKAKVRNLAKFEEELKTTQAIFNQTAELLPKDKEIPKLLKDISSLGRVAGLDFLKFQPLADRPKDFYSEIPVNINVRGPYHNMGYFFDQVSKLERIVSVSNVKMTNPKKEAGELLLKSNCQLVTYRFTNKKLQKDTKKKKKRRKR
ncbi:MAG: type 4a pilus biogenesis protein PilO [Bacteroidetes bacterium]|nr:type 4a pilus biogenesis protein PilO [Bacteroidota bacterium]